MKTKFLAAAAAVMLAAGITCAAEDAYPSAMTPDAAVEYALENHTAILAAKSNITQNEAKVKEAYDSYAKNRYNSFANGYATIESVMVKNGVYYLSANMGLELAKAGYAKTEESIKNGVHAAYYAYINSRTRVENTLSALETATTRYNDEVSRKNLGLSSEYEVMVADNTKMRAQSDYDTALRSENTALAQLKNAVGLPLSADVKFTAKSMQLPEMPDITLEAAVAKAKENSVSIKSARLSVSVQEATFKATKSWYSANTFAYKNAESALEYARDSYANELAAAEISVYTAHDNMMSTLDNAKIAESSLQLAEKTYEIKSKQYELGLIAKLELDDSWYNLQSLKLQKSELDNAIYSAIKQFEMSYSY